jgi:ADP-L-glycero-D-manno-heptose 6-epimerase
MVILTGGAGFIGSVLLKTLNLSGISDILIVDRLGNEDKWKNLNGKFFSDFIHKDKFFSLMDSVAFPKKTTHIIHLGACSSTTEKDSDYLMHNNFKFSKVLATHALSKKIPFIYASSAATYGDGNLGFKDDEEALDQLRPLNCYGFSKHLFDQWIIKQPRNSQVVGLKFFNVFGPNEYHKGSMKSLVERAYHQVLDSGKIKLFKSEHPDFKNGEQKRDFVYVKDVAAVIYWFMKNQKSSGIFNVGTGIANSWVELANSIFKGLNKSPTIEFIDLPQELKDKYQYYTCAPIDKLKQIGCDVKFTDLSSSVVDYVQNHLLKSDKYL